VTWDGAGSWWTDANNSQSVIDRMVSRSICGLTNQKNDAQAWSAIFHYFNRTHGRGNNGYKTGEKIAIKANLNNTTDHGMIERLNSSTHLLFSLVRQLTAPGRVPASSITVFDSSRWIPGNLYDKIHPEFPGVVFVDDIGGDGRLKAEFKPNAIPFSVETNNAKGLDTTVVEAAYLIDVRSDTLREKSVWRDEHQYRLAEKRARRFPPQHRWFGKLLRIHRLFGP